MNAIKVLWQRQIKKYIRSRARIVGSLGQPLLFLLVFGLGFSKIFAAAGQGSYIKLLAPGIMLMSVVFTAIFTGLEVIWDRQFGFLKETLVAPVSRFSIMLGKTLGGATVSLIQGVIVFIVTLIVGFHPIWSGVLQAFLSLFVIGALFSAFGIALASRMKDMQAFPIIMNFVVMPLFFLSGAIFPVGTASGILKTLATVNPLSYGMDFVRGALTGIYNFSFTTDALILILVTTAMLLWGAYSFSRVEV